MPLLGQPVEPAHAEIVRPWWREVGNITVKPTPGKEDDVTVSTVGTLAVGLTELIIALEDRWLYPAAQRWQVLSIHTDDAVATTAFAVSPNGLPFFVALSEREHQGWR